MIIKQIHKNLFILNHEKISFISILAFIDLVFEAQYLNKLVI